MSNKNQVKEEETSAKNNFWVGIVFVCALIALIGLFAFRIYLSPIIKGTYDTAVQVFPIFILIIGISGIAMQVYLMYYSKVLDRKDRIAIFAMFILLLTIACGLFLYMTRIL